MGRRTQLTPDLIAALINEARGGMPLRLAARAHGISKSTFYDWMRWGAQGRPPFSELSDHWHDESENCRRAIEHRSRRQNANAAANTSEIESLVVNLGHAIAEAVVVSLSVHPHDQALRACEEVAQHCECALHLLERDELADNPAADAVRRELQMALCDAKLRTPSVPPATEPVPISAPGGNSGTPANALPSQGTENVFLREGEYWTLAFDGVTVRLRDTKGMHYIAQLVREPGRDFHAVDLLSIADRSFVEGGVAPPNLCHAGDLLDARAKSVYRRRLVDLRDELEEAEAINDLGRADHARTEIEFLSHELARAVGLGGRNRCAGDRAERARVNVTRAIRLVLDKIAAEHPSLGHHLNGSIKTGNFCSYAAAVDPAPVWRV